MIKEQVNEYEHILFSYHGLPERQITKNNCKSICIDTCPVISEMNQGCYKAQCHQSSRLLAKELQLSEQQYSTAFQSRLGRTPG